MTSTAEGRARGSDLWTFFAVTWAAAVVFHLAGNTRLAPEWGRGLLGVTAVLLLARPRNPWLSLPLAAAVVTNVWLEAPILGNHWLLHGFLAVLVAVSVLSVRGRPEEVIARLAGPARLLLLAFYGFAAFAKLNADFFDPALSCAVFYMRESADSWGAIGLVDGLSGGSEQAVAVVVAAIELSIPLLLWLRRTRSLGVAVGLSFHYILAVDRDHQFFDFSSVLFVLFLLFLEPEVRAQIVDRLRRAARALADRWESGPELIGLCALAVVAGVVVFASGPSAWSAPRHLRIGGVFTWLVLGASVTAIAVHTLVTTRARGEIVPPRALVPGRQPWWMFIVPVVALLNGSTPYLEVKAGTSWNMYSNLAVVDGSSNHLLVRAGLPLTDGHERLVRVVDSTDSRLTFYDGDPWLLPEVQLEDHLADLPDSVVEASVNGASVGYEGGGGGARPVWQQKFQVFRAVDGDGPTNCQPSFGPAR